MRCRVCNSSAQSSGLLHKCQDPSCGAAHWDKTRVLALRNQNLSSNNQAMPLWVSEVLNDADVPHWSHGENFVYRIRLRGPGLRDYWQDLCRNDRAASICAISQSSARLSGVKGCEKFGTAMIGFEVSESREVALQREGELAEKLRTEGYDVHVGTDKVKSPFSRQQRNQLLAWSKFAKESDVLNGYQRKVIYEGGHYNYVFISRLNQITDALRSLRDHLEDDEDDLADEILCCSYVCFLEAKAEEGNLEAQYYLGDGFIWGLYRLEEDEPRAAALIEAAAKQGHEEALATIDLGTCTAWC